MSRQASELQYKVMSLSYRGKEIFKPLNTGWIDEHVACAREFVANIFFYVKGDTTLMIDAGYNYDRLGEKMGWLGIDPASVKDILITHQDTDHVGAVERDSPGLFRNTTLYVGEEENRYLTGEVRRRVYWGTYKLPQVYIDNKKVLLKDGDVLDIGGVRVEALLVPGHTWGHMVYLVDDAYLFTGDTIWFGPDGGYSFLNTLAEDNKLAVRSLAHLQETLRSRDIAPKVITGHTGWTDDLDFVFAHTDEVCHAFFRQKPHDPKAPYDAYIEDDDTEQAARSGLLPAVEPIAAPRDAGFWNRFAGVYDFATRSGDAGLAQAADYVATFLDEHDVVLDAACGTGAFACRLAPCVGFVAGCDLAPKMVQQAARKAEKLGLDNVAFGEGDLCALDFANDVFDAAVAGNVLHLLSDPQVALSELQRVVRPGGIVAIPNYVNAEAEDRRFLSLIEAVGFSSEHEWDEPGFLAFLSQEGLQVVEHRSFVAKQPLCVAICRVP
ncbi:MAG: methyltransferase domain-containing protein [Atopobiaceae bacterium]|nr:methyltransferase domain-containing protein [Atopobiaceae bacterium]MBR1830173.1 methyltransferase domain-containing protein [Atopobiaceae bacterium]